MLNIAIIGFGYWGPNLLRNFYTNQDTKVKYLVDARQERLDIAQMQYPNILGVNSIEEIIEDSELDAVVIATPVFTHFEIAKRFLEKGKHVLIEKPMTSTSEEAAILKSIAEKNNLILMVDYTFLYTSSVQKIKNIIDNGDLGTLQYFDSTRINLGLIQQDVNVLWDLAPHDLSILSYIYPYPPKAVQAIGTSHIHNGIENIAYLTVKYDSPFIAHFHCSWSSPVKVRNIMIGGDKQMILYNDNEPTEKIKIYDTGFSVKDDDDKRMVLIDYRIGDIFVPKIENKEALSLVAKDFVQAIKTGQQPVGNKELGLLGVQILEAAQKSIKNKGTEIEL